MSDNREKRYNRDFLKWTSKNFELGGSKYKPFFHVFPSNGLLNDPNCVFYKDGKYFVFFQHHPTNPIHGLKTMSLAITKDFKDFDYSYMINKPENKFDSHGIYSGNAIKYKDNIIAMYTGNVRDKDWIRTSYVVISHFDIKTKSFKNKKTLLSNFDCKDYTEHFRDPYIFKYKNNLYFLLGAQHKNGYGVILLFKFSSDLKEAKLINEIIISLQYRMIECPNIMFIKNKAILVYSPQLKDELTKKGTNPDLVRYVVIGQDVLFNKDNNFIINLNKKSIKENVLDYGLEFYAPQTFLKSRKWNIIGWTGIPTSIDYPETIEGWIFMLSMVKEVDLVNNKLVMREIKNFKNNYINSSNKKAIYNSYILKPNNSLFLYDKTCKKLSIEFRDSEEQKIVITRFDDKKYYPYDSRKEIMLDNKYSNIRVEIFLDASIIEIKIDNGKYWYTSRIYLEDEFEIRSKYE